MAAPVNFDPLSVEHGPVQTTDCFIGFSPIRELHEAVSLGGLGDLIENEVSRNNTREVLSKVIGEIFTSGSLA